VSTRSRVTVLAGCLVVVLLAAWLAGTQHSPMASMAPTGTVRLGPEAGEDVAAYLAQLPASLPPDGVRAPALVQFRAAVTPVEALAAVAGTTPRTAVFRVPLPRVQTALRFEALEPGLPAATALDSARLRAQGGAEADAARLADRPRAVAAAEAAALADPACACVLAVVVRADRAALEALVASRDVRAVDAAPVGATEPELALSPLLPGQVERVDPPPDDGPVPPA
jgi:hypothetical protein